MTYTLEAKGYPVIGHEVDYFKVTDLNSSESCIISMSDLISRTLGEEFLLGDGIDDAFINRGCDSKYDWWNRKTEQTIIDYQTETKRDYPKLCKIKITFEAEPLPEEEIQNYWKEQNRHRKQALIDRENFVEEQKSKDYII